MKYADKRAEAIAIIRADHNALALVAGIGPTHFGLVATAIDMADWFFCNFIMDDATYWWHEKIQKPFVLIEDKATVYKQPDPAECREITQGEYIEIILKQGPRMKYADKRAHGIALLREWAEEEAKAGHVRAAHTGLLSALRALVDEFRVKHEVPGVRYFESYVYQDETTQHRDHFTTFNIYPDDLSRPKNTQIVEVTRNEFLARKGLRWDEDTI